jgi:hypothetical protein
VLPRVIKAPVYCLACPWAAVRQRLHQLTYPLYCWGMDTMYSTAQPSTGQQITSHQIAYLCWG